MGEYIVAISQDFFDAFAKLQRPIQGKVTEFINKFRNNPTSPGINYEKVHDAIDKKMHSVRIDQTYRGIVVRQEETGVFLLLWVDHHDEAYTWARRKKCEINKETGSIQVFEIRQEVLVNKVVQDSLFSKLTDEQLLKLGVPEEQIILLRSFAKAEEFYGAKASIPKDAYEALEWVLNDIPFEEVIDLFGATESAEDDFAQALESENNQRSFVVVEGEEELRNMMAAPLEKWRIFLHPTQKKLVIKTYNGPARVLGGAGTGKTVVAMHRAKQLTMKLKDKEKILFTTFTANLASDIKENLRKICSVEEQRRIEVINLDQWVIQFLRENGYTYRIVYGDKLEEIWNDAISQSGEDLGLSIGFFKEEWSKVVAEHEAYTKEKFVKASRIGRGTRIGRRQKLQIWNVFEEYLNIMKDQKIRDVDMAMYECKKVLDKNTTGLRYKSIIVDEGQDFSSNAYRFLRTLAGEERKNDIFIVGDAHQRIYKNKAVLSRVGINIRGRASRLKINYRTTEETRKFAFALLKGLPFDDLDEGYDDGRVCQSLTHGTAPVVANLGSANEELEFIINEIKKLEDAGVDLKDICIVTRTHKLLDDYIAQLTSAGYRTFEIKRSKIDDRSIKGIRVATMHRVKGLEFQYVFIAAVNHRIVPLTSVINGADDVAKDEALTAEKCLLYVALTRAQKQAFVSSYGKASEFLEGIDYE